MIIILRKPLLKTSLLVIVLLICGLHSQLLGQQDQHAEQVTQSVEQETPRLDWVDELIGQPEQNGIAGCVCAIINNDEVLHLQGYGVQDRETRIAIDPARTRFYLASVTKVFTATLVWRLIDQGLLDLDEDISVYLKGQPKLKLLPNSQPVTLRHLLTHSAGFDDRNIGMIAESADKVQSLQHYFATAVPYQVRPAGEITMYDNHGWALAGLVCEHVTGLSYPELLQQEIFDPLNMSGSGVSNKVFQTNNLNFAQPYVTRYEDDRLTWKKVPLSFRRTLPAGGICASGNAMVNFIQMHLNQGVTGDTRYLSESAASRMQTQAWTSLEGVEGLTPGFWETQILSQRVLMIVGDAPEGSSLIAIIPDLQLGLFMAASRQEASFLVSKLRPILERLVTEKKSVGEPQGTETRVAEAQGTASTTGWQERARAIAGEYYILRFSQNSIEALAKWQAWIRVEVLEPGKIRVVDSQEQTRDYVEVSDYVFRHPEHPGYISFKSSSDGKNQWATTNDGFGFTRGFGFANSFQKASWYERLGVKRPVLLCGLLVFMISIVIWPLGFVIKRVVSLLRRKKSDQKQVKGSLWQRVIILCMAVCGLTGTLGVAALLANTDQLLFGYPQWGAIPFYLIWAFVVLVPISLWLTVSAWRYHWWSLLERILASIVSLTAAIWIPFLWDWNLIAV